MKDSFARTMRMVWIADHLAATGQINRADIRQAFGISTPQSSVDLRHFMAMFPTAMTYDTRSKTYRIADRSGFTRAFPLWQRHAIRNAVNSIHATLTTARPPQPADSPSQ